MTQPARRFSPSTLWNIAKIITAILLVGFVLSRTDLTQLYALRERILLPWLVTDILLYFLLTLLKAFQYYFLIGRRVSYPNVLNIVVVQNAISNFIATGAGIASYLTLFHMEQGVKLSRAALAFLLAKVGDLISIWLFMLVATILAWPRVVPLHGLMVILLAGIGFAVLMFFLAVFLREKFASMIKKIIAWLRLERIGLVNKGMDTLQTLTEQQHGFVFRIMGISILFSLLYMTVTMLWIYAGLQTFSFSIGVLPVVFVNAIMQLVSYLPIQVFGGLGVNETTMMYIYGFFDFPQSEIAAVLIAVRLLYYLTNLLVLLYLPAHALFFGHSKISNQASQ